MDNNKRGIVYVLTTMVLFSTGGIFIKLIGANAITITFGRSMFAGLIFCHLFIGKK